MKIKKYTKLKSNKYNVLIDNEEIKLYDDVIIKYELLRKKEISDTLFEEIIEYNKNLEAYYKALKYISKKLRTKKELFEYLHKEYSKNTTDKTIEILKQEGYLNEEIYLNCYFSDSLNLTNKGPNRIKKELIKLGYSEEIINDRLNTINDNIWLDKIHSIVKKKISTNKSYGNNKLKEKILYDLSNMGYYKWMIEEVIQSIEFNNNEDIILKEYQKAYQKLSKKYNGYDLQTKVIAKLVSKGFLYEDAKNIVEQNKKDF